MLNLALLTLLFLVASALWLLLRPPGSIPVRRDGPDNPAPIEGADSAEPPDHADAYVVAPPQQNEHTPNR